MVMKNLQFRTAASRECQRAVPKADLQRFFKGADDSPNVRLFFNGVPRQCGLPVRSARSAPSRGSRRGLAGSSAGGRSLCFEKRPASVSEFGHRAKTKHHKQHQDNELNG